MRSRLMIVAAGFAVLFAACGGSGSSSHSGMNMGGDATTTPVADGTATRTVQVTMKDVKFSPATVSVKAGETIKFVFKNEDATTHDAFIGTDAEQMDHDKTMSDSSSDTMGGNSHGMSDNAITVAAGKSGSLTHTFKAGEMVLIGCHEPGHYASGMRLAITVA